MNLIVGHLLMLSPSFYLLYHVNASKQQNPSRGLMWSMHENLALMLRRQEGYKFEVSGIYIVGFYLKAQKTSILTIVCKRAQNI